MQNMLYEHLRLTTIEVNARLKGDYVEMCIRDSHYSASYSGTNGETWLTVVVQ